jgi:hypothetical protein
MNEFELFLYKYQIIKTEGDQIIKIGDRIHSPLTRMRTVAHFPDTRPE